MKCNAYLWVEKGNKMTRGGLTTQKAEVLCLHCNNFVIPAVRIPAPAVTSL